MKLFNSLRLSAFFLICLLSIFPILTSIQEDLQESDWRPFVSVGSGGLYVSNLLYLNPLPLWGSSRSSSTHVGNFFDIFLGAEWQKNPAMPIQVGLDFNQFSIKFDNEMRSANVNINHLYVNKVRQVLAQGKVLFNGEANFHPYCLAGLGLVFKNSHHHLITTGPSGSNTEDAKGFCNTSFSVGLGIGFDYDITKNIRLGLGYKFSDLGKFIFEDVTVGGLRIRNHSEHHLYGHQVLAQISFIY